jgi:hypothetical protein
MREYKDDKARRPAGADTIFHTLNEAKEVPSGSLSPLALKYGNSQREPLQIKRKAKVLRRARLSTFFDNNERREWAISRINVVEDCKEHRSVSVGGRISHKNKRYRKLARGT